MSVSKGVITKLFWIGVGAIGFILLGWLIGALTSEAADLKVVTIKFKNDSELKLKTQWFVNHCDMVNTRWQPCYLGADSIRVRGDNVIAFFEFDSTLVRGDKNDSCLVQWWPPTVTCRTLLFEPDVRREPKPYTYEKWPAEDSREWKMTWMDSTYVVQPIIVTDTIPGEALLWYEETR